MNKRLTNFVDVIKLTILNYLHPRITQKKKFYSQFDQLRVLLKDSWRQVVQLHFRQVPINSTKIQRCIVQSQDAYKLINQMTSGMNSVQKCSLRSVQITQTGNFCDFTVRYFCLKLKWRSCKAFKTIRLLHRPLCHLSGLIP